MRVNASGDSLWSRTYGGSHWDRCYYVQETPDNGFILAGSNASFDPYNNDFWLIKTDDRGNILWNRTYGGAGSEECYSAQQTSDGGYILAGQTCSFGAGLCDFVLGKTDSEGTPLWARTFGGSQTDECTSVQQTPEGSYIMAGYTESFGAGWGDFWLVETGPERPYHTTVYLDPSLLIPIVRWIAPQRCDYRIYSTTNMGEIGQPPGPGWDVAAELMDVPGGSAEWPDPAGIVDYKRYAVTMDCP